MCDKANRAEKPELQAAAREDTATATPQVAAAATATPQVAAAATAAAKVAPQVAAQVAVRKAAAHKDVDSKKTQVVDPEFARAENEDDDGYDPYSDRRPVSEPLFERDPWS